MRPMTIAVAATLIASTVLVAVLAIKSGEVGSPFAEPFYLGHTPILIESESQLNVANGVTSGDGSPGNPYVIQGWDIDASGTTTVGMAGIAVANITSHLVIRHVSVYSGNSSGNSGIVLINVTNCLVEDSQLVDDSIGIAAMECGQLAIQNNTVQICGNGGIMVIDTNSVLIEHNVVGVASQRFANMGLSSPIPSVAITLMNSTGSSVVNNSMSHSGAGLFLISCSQTVVAGNHLYADSVGLSMMMCNWSDVHDNQAVVSFTNGISMLMCENNTLYDNILAFTLSDGSMWTGYGAWLFGCANNTLYHNEFIDNYMSPQAFDYIMGGANRWNITDVLGGNYWSPLTGSPYQIDSNVATYDYSPLASEPAIALGSHALFVVTPASGTNSTLFQFDATPSWRSGTLWRELQYRWDFDGDGTWDTGWLDGNTTQHTYDVTGEFSVILEVKDADGRMDNITRYVEVEPYEIPEFTGLILPVLGLLSILAIVMAERRRRERTNL